MFKQDHTAACERAHPGIRHSDECSRGCPWFLQTRRLGRVQKDTRRELERFWEDSRYKLAPMPDNSTVAEWAPRFLELRSKRRLATLKQYEIAIRVHITEPRYGLAQRKMRTLRWDEVGAWYRAMQADGVAPSALWMSAAVLSMMWNAWKKSGRPLDAGGNPVDRDWARQPASPEKPPLMDAEVARWIAAARPDLVLILQFEHWYALRSGEVLGLAGDDLTWDGRNPRLPLAPQLAALAALPTDEYRLRDPRVRFRAQLAVLTGTRELMKNDDSDRDSRPSHAVRAVKLPRHLAQDLAGRLDKIPVHPETGLVFWNPLSRDRGHWRYNTYRKELHAAARRAGITLPPNQASHALRHHRIADLKKQRWRNDEIAKFVGTTEELISRTYGKASKADVDAISDRMEAEWERAQGRHLRPAGGETAR
jgi:hypothetical protein